MFDAAASLAAPRSILGRLPAGEAGVRATLKLMRAFVRHGKKDLAVRGVALQLVRPLEQRDYVGEVRALHAFVRDRIRYVGDVRGVETLHSARRILQQGQGDCDDKSILLAALLESINHPTRFVAVGFSPTHVDHVLLETRIGRRWVPLETTEPVGVNWYPAGIRKTLVLHN